MSNLNNYLYRVREKLGWTLREAAERAGISFSRLGEIERGRDSHSGKPIVPSYVTLCRLAAAYGLPPAELLSRAGHKPGPELTCGEWRLLDAYRRLPSPRQDELVAALEHEAGPPVEPGVPVAIVASDAGAGAGVVLDRLSGSPLGMAVPMMPAADEAQQP